MNALVGCLYAAAWRSAWRFGYHARKFQLRVGAVRVEPYDVRSRMTTTDRRAP